MEKTCPHPTCGHTWTPRKAEPKKCPQCQNPLWQSPKPKRRKHDFTVLEGQEGRALVEEAGILPDSLPLDAPGRLGAGENDTVTAQQPINDSDALMELLDNSANPTPPEPIEKDSLSAAKAKAEELLRMLA